MNDESALADAQKYTVQSSGKCQTMDGKDPKYKFYGSAPTARIAVTRIRIVMDTRSP